jgi:hypothetical protein
LKFENENALENALETAHETADGNASFGLSVFTREYFLKGKAQYS